MNSFFLLIASLHLVFACASDQLTDLDQKFLTSFIVDFNNTQFNSAVWQKRINELKTNQLNSKSFFDKDFEIFYEYEKENFQKPHGSFLDSCKFVFLKDMPCSLHAHAKKHSSYNDARPLLREILTIPRFEQFFTRKVKFIINQSPTMLNFQGNFGNEKQ